MVAPPARAVSPVKSPVERVVPLALLSDSANVPFPDVVGAVAARLQQLGNRRASLIQSGRVAGRLPILQEVTHARLMRIKPREQRSPRRGATGCVVELREAHASRG